MRGMKRINLRFALLLGWVMALLLVVALAPQLCPHDPNAQVFEALQPPSWAHWCGTDRYGRDLFSRVLVGLQTSVCATLALVAIITTLGTAVGVACGYWGGVLDRVCMGICDVCLAFPPLVLALALAALFQGGLAQAVVALALVSWPKYARLARSQTLAVKEADFIQAARLAGDTGVQLLVRHILPHVLGPILVTTTLDVGTMMMELAGLSFLGLGAQPPTAELGSMMSAGRSMLQTNPWVIFAPGGAIFVAVSIFRLLGDGMRDYLDPRSEFHET